MRILAKLAVGLFALTLLGGVVGAGGVVYALWYYGKDLPDHKQLADYEPPMTTRVHAGDGRLIAEFAIEKRVFVPITAIPARVKQAFLAAEDQNFYTHPGVDFVALARAVVQNVMLVAQGRRPIGASTITQQVAKNFLLTNDLSLERKIREAILAFRIEKALSKDRILELYLNEIYLGYGSYGVAAAALNYFDKPLDAVTVDEAAYMAALPKAPNNYHPVRRTEAAIARRNWVIGRMVEDGHIDADEAMAAMQRSLGVTGGGEAQIVDAGFFLEEVRRELADRYGDTGLYKGGLSVSTTLDPTLQAIAERALKDGLLAYDLRHGWRGATATLPVTDNWLPQLNGVELRPGDTGWMRALVFEVGRDEARIGLEDGSGGAIPLAETRWARRQLDNEARSRGPAVRSVAEVLQPGDVIYVEPVSESTPEEGKQPVAYPPGTYALRQVPEAQGGLVALDPHTGRVLAMAGGWSFEESEFNRAVQARRQPGSAFKPFVYLAALERGYTPSTIILDAPVVIDQGPGLGKWKPSNFSNQFYGPSTMRLGIELSRNLMTVRLAQAVGMPAVVDMATRFGIVDRLDPVLSMSLGAGETTVLRLTAAYAMLVNGGKRITPTLIDRVQDRDGRTMFRHDARGCEGCDYVRWVGQAVPVLPDTREQLVDAASAYQMVSMLEGAISRGTGRTIAELGRPLAGKTGTTNDGREAWFVGFSPDLAVGLYVGFDQPTPLGRTPWGSEETGSSAAAPIFKAFMADALRDSPRNPFRTPPDVRLVRIDAKTGELAGPGTEKVILEAFKPGTEPARGRSGVFIAGNVDNGDVPDAAAGEGSGDTGTTGGAPAPSSRQSLPQSQDSTLQGGLY